jgi:hypothetical protein
LSTPLWEEMAGGSHAQVKRNFRTEISPTLPSTLRNLSTFTDWTTCKSGLSKTIDCVCTASYHRS